MLQPDLSGARLVEGDEAPGGEVGAGLVCEGGAVLQAGTASGPGAELGGGVSEVGADEEGAPGDVLPPDRDAHRVRATRGRREVDCVPAVAVIDHLPSGVPRVCRGVAAPRAEAVSK